MKTGMNGLADLSIDRSLLRRRKRTEFDLSFEWQKETKEPFRRKARAFSPILFVGDKSSVYLM